MKPDLTETDRLLAKIDTTISQERTRKAVDRLLDTGVAYGYACGITMCGCSGTDDVEELLYNLRSPVRIPGTSDVYYTASKMTPARDAQRLHEQQARYKYSSVEHHRERGRVDLRYSTGTPDPDGDDKT